MLQICIITEKVKNVAEMEKLKTEFKKKFRSKLKFCQKSKFCSNIEILVKNLNFGLQSKFRSKIEILVEHRNYDQNWNIFQKWFCWKSTFYPKIFVQSYNFGKKLKFSQKSRKCLNSDQRCRWKLLNFYTKKAFFENFRKKTWRIHRNYSNIELFYQTISFLILLLYIYFPIIINKMLFYKNKWNPFW